MLLAATVRESRFDAERLGVREVSPTSPDATVHAVEWTGPALVEPDPDTRTRTLCGAFTQVTYPTEFRPVDEDNVCPVCRRHAAAGTVHQVAFSHGPRTADARCVGGPRDGELFDAATYEGRPVPLLKVGPHRYRLKPGQRPQRGQRWVYVPDAAG